MRIALVGCSKQKLDHAAEARDLYQGPLFKAARAYAETMDDWYILSAKHGLISPYAWTEPYDLALRDMHVYQRKAWAQRVYHATVGVTKDRDASLVILAGQDYRDWLELMLERKFTVEVPLRGLGIGSQMKRLRELTP